MNSAARWLLAGCVCALAWALAALATLAWAGWHLENILDNL